MFLNERIFDQLFIYLNTHLIRLNMSTNLRAKFECIMQSTLFKLINLESTVFRKQSNHYVDKTCIQCRLDSKLGNRTRWLNRLFDANFSI